MGWLDSKESNWAVSSVREGVLSEIEPWEDATLAIIAIAAKSQRILHWLSEVCVEIWGRATFWSKFGRAIALSSEITQIVHLRSGQIFRLGGCYYCVASTRAQMEQYLRKQLRNELVGSSRSFLRGQTTYLKGSIWGFWPEIFRFWRAMGRN